MATYYYRNIDSGEITESDSELSDPGLVLVSQTTSADDYIAPVDPNAEEAPAEQPKSRRAKA